VSLPATRSGGAVSHTKAPFLLVQPYTFTKEQKMIRLVVFVAGVVVGALGTVVVEHPKKVATKVRQAADFVIKKIREAYEAGESPDDNPAAGPGEKAA
jgi:hypothetical protein